MASIYQQRSDEFFSTTDPTTGSSGTPSIDQIHSLHPEGMYLKKYKSGTDIEIFSYPSSIGNHEGADTYKTPGFVQFQVVVREKSKFKDDIDKSREVNVRQPDTAQLDLDTISSAVRTGAQAAQGGTRGLFSLLSNNSDSKRSSTTGSRPTEEAAKQDVGTEGPLDSIKNFALTAFDKLKPDNKFFIKDVVNLYLSAPPAVKYNANYQNADLGVVAASVAAIADIASGQKSYSQAGSAASEAFTASGLRFLNIPSALGLPSVTNLFGAVTGQALNPFREVLFESMNFRQFQFTYKFMVENKAEAREVKSIIQLFKYYMHPGLSANKFFLEYPGEFHIKYHWVRPNQINPASGGLRTFIHEFKPCFLEDVEVLYGGDQVSFFPDGEPTEINLKLTFRENEILTQDSISEGY